MLLELFCLRREKIRGDKLILKLKELIESFIGIIFRLGCWVFCFFSINLGVDFNYEFRGLIILM